MNAELKVRDIMSSQVVCLSDQASLKDAHLLMQSRGVRHLPVISEEDGSFVGIVTHKKMVASVISLLNKYGTGALERKERFVPISDIVETEIQQLNSDQALCDVVDLFIGNKHGCLPVVNENKKVEGIVTSSDFIKLCAKLLKDA
ncbi:CBS domain-containing protein [Shewanella gelidii]|uniref:CBS domain-containing protein n=1 Tax=Shewanella gelidii TaxID=1642821 RepID=A0A917JIV5_9GAMM|nr:CBS domain-containing protein [Shewanella gelidii]